jgi:hypothetical protein
MTPAQGHLDAGDPGEAAARRGARVALVAFLALSSLFVVSSTWQLARAVFVDGSPGAPSLQPEGTCARDLRRLSLAVERGLAASSAAPTEETSAAAFEAALRPDWDDAAAKATAACAVEPAGMNAYAAVERLRAAALGFAKHRATDLVRVRQEVSAQLGR